MTNLRQVVGLATDPKTYRLAHPRYELAEQVGQYPCFSCPYFGVCRTGVGMSPELCKSLALVSDYRMHIELVIDSLSGVAEDDSAFRRVERIWRFVL